jgi:hypothetical protein
MSKKHADKKQATQQVKEESVGSTALNILIGIIIVAIMALIIIWMMRDLL